MKHTLKATFLAAAVLAAALPGAARADFIVVGSQNDNRITTDTRWTRDNVYILGRIIIVSNGAKLTIEPGTIIRGLRELESDITEEPGALVIARGSKIVANGTVDAPIIFTSIDDPNVPGGAATVPSSFTNLRGRLIDVSALANNYAPGGLSGNNGFAKSGLWGGIILCGRGHVAANTKNADADDDGIWDAHGDSLTENFRRIQNAGIGTDYPEGLSSGSGSNVLNSALTIYGGTDDDDDSGVMRYVVNRYGGYVVGAAAVGNEINGITICGVGSGFVFEHCEVFQNKDDGFEWFGGKHDSRFLFSSANQDDAFDGDEGFRGNHQFWTAIQGTINTTGPSLRSGHDGSNLTIGQTESAADYQYDKLMEWDGGEPDNGDRLPMTDVNVFNFTMLAGGTKFEGFNPKLEAHIAMHNGIVENANNVSRAAETGGGAIFTQLTWSNLYAYRATPPAPNSNLPLPAFSNVGVGTASATVGGVNYTILNQITMMQQSEVSQIRTPWRFAATSTPVVPCPLYTKNGLDPRLNPAGVAYDVPFAGGVTLPAGFINAAFAGAMRDNNAMFGWTSLHALQVFPTDNLDRPVVVLGEDEGHPTVNFEAADADVLYVVEKSVDGKQWTVLTPEPLTGSAGAVSYTDTTSGAADTVLYRVYGL